MVCLAAACGKPARRLALALKGNSVILYKGPSLLDGKPIVAILIPGKSHNRKTGAMVQTYIIRSEISPIVASQTGKDASICGDCPHRGKANGEVAKGRSCYVLTNQGPSAVYSAYKRGLYSRYNRNKLAKLVSGRTIRLGTYGDPAAVPAKIWQDLLSLPIDGHTGYTHQWAKPEFSALRSFCMASVDTEAQAQAAKSAGWRYFRVRPENGELWQGEIICPASAEAGKRLTCEQCLACDGAGTNGLRASVVIKGHGGFAVKSNVERNLLQLSLRK